MKFQYVAKDLRSLADPDKALELARFFKTAPGDYGYGDKFLGITVPQTRKIAKKYQALDLKEIEKLLDSKFHEFRFCGLVILTLQFKKAQESAKQKQLFNFYIRQAKKGRINNWDLVDVTAPIMGRYLFNELDFLNFLSNLATSRSLWLRRISLLLTFAFIREGKFEPTLTISKQLLNDNHDLIHKAVGWALREVGNRNKKILIKFLSTHSKDMNRITLRYSIEKFSENERKYWLKK